MVIVYYILLAVTLIYSLYFSLTGLWAFVRPENNEETDENGKKNRFAIIIAARNEAGVIGNLIDSINAQNYDRDCFTVYTAVNNCTDNTEYVARRHGSEIISCPASVRSKGDVLRQVFGELGEREDIDAFVIFDADNIVHPDYLLNMNRAINRGAEVAQCKRDSKNLSDNWISAGYSLFYYVQNFFFNRARSRVGLSASINGTGFMVKRETLKKTGFDTHTLTEDVEFTAICALKGVRIDFVEDAVTYDEQPVGFMDSCRQRRRWSAGNLQCFSRYNPSLIGTFLRTGRISCLDMAMSFSAPVIQVLSVVMVAMLMGFRLFNVELGDIFSYIFAYGWIFFAATYISGLIVCALILRHNHHSVNDSPSGLLLFTVFLLTWVPINIICIVRRRIAWAPIKHSRNVSIDSLIQHN